VTIVVLDTNVLASGFASRPSSIPALLIDAWHARQFTLVVSRHILTELARTFESTYFRRRLSLTEVAADLALLRRQAIISPITAQVRGVATHPEDDLILATAVSAQADYLVTGDTKLQGLATYQGVTILSPRAFLELLSQDAQVDD
jgi:putative PIN family toxin of toxin-antitoxin system